MKRMMLLMILPLSLAAYFGAATTPTNTEAAYLPPATRTAPAKVHQAVASAPSEHPSPLPDEKENKGDKKQLVTFAMSLLGTPYVYAGVSPEGFDCSGFVTYVFKKFARNVPHSSALQAKEGKQVAREEASVGDLVIFTGTNPEVRTPGHVGIIISTDDDTLEFVHSSSVGGVKVSKVEGTGYSRRFLQIRRIF